jgi:transketolase
MNTQPVEKQPDPQQSDTSTAYPNQGMKDTRSGFGAGLLELGQADDSIVALCADLTGSVKMDKFAEAFPQRFFSAGVAEANMMSTAAGLTIGGKRPFAGTFANFATGRVFDQVRQSIAYSNKNVKICASHAGLTLGQDGATHQILEDIGLMQMLPNMTVIVPCDYNQTRLATLALGEYVGPTYLRFGRPKMPNFTPPEDPDFAIGRAIRMRAGSDVTLVACGHLVWKALQAAEALAEEGIDCELLNMHTIKPLDEEALLTSVSKTGRVVTCEEHQKIGGLGSTVSMTLTKRQPVLQEQVAVNDRFGESGTPDELLAKYELDTPDVIAAVRRILQRPSR